MSAGARDATALSPHLGRDRSPDNPADEPPRRAAKRMYDDDLGPFERRGPPERDFEGHGMRGEGGRRPDMGDDFVEQKRRRFIDEDPLPPYRGPAGKTPGTMLYMLVLNCRRDQYSALFFLVC